jgi:hypothetical protein
MSKMHQWLVTHLLKMKIIYNLKTMMTFLINILDQTKRKNNKIQKNKLFRLLINNQDKMNNKLTLKN